MQGVSEVIAIILILMITISLAGLAYMFMSTTMSDVTASASSTVDATTSSMLTSFSIESIDIAKVYVRNTGQSALTSLSVYVNDEPAIYDVTPNPIAAGSVSTITIYSFIPDGATVKITSPSGFSTSKVAHPCDKAAACWNFDEGKIVLDDDYPNFHGWSDNRTSECGSYSVMGGFNLFGTGALTEKTVSLPQGTYRIDFNFLKLDSWDSELGRLFYNGNLIWSKSYSAGSGSQICGQSSSGWNELLDPISVELAHQGGTARFTFDSTLNQAPGDESWGINGIVITEIDAIDSSPNLNNGIVHGADWVTVANGGALSFDGIDDFVNISDSEGLDGGSGITVSAWLYISSFRDYDKFVSKMSGSSSTDVTFYLQVSAGNRLGWKVASPSQLASLDSDITLQAGQWYYVAAVYNGTAAYMYVNGVKQSSVATMTGNVNNTVYPVVIGANRLGTSNLNGTMDEVRIYSRAIY